MVNVTIKRLRHGDDGTFGLMRLFDGSQELTLATGELPWRSNTRGISCIPTGTYRAYKSFSPKFNTDMYELANVPNRTQILIHHGNFCGDPMKNMKTDVAGCILVGVGHGRSSGQTIVTQSREALRRLNNFTKGEPLEIVIT